MKFTDLIPGKIYFQEYNEVPYKYVFIYTHIENSIRGSDFINVDAGNIGCGGKDYCNDMKESTIRPANPEEIQQLCDYHGLNSSIYLTPSYEIY